MKYKDAISYQCKCGQEVVVPLNGVFSAEMHQEANNLLADMVAAHQNQNRCVSLYFTN